MRVNRYFHKNKTVNEEGGTIAIFFRRFLLPLQKLQSLKVEIVNINDFAHVVKMALQLYDFEDFAIVTDWSFYRVWKFRLDEASGDCILGIQGSRTDFRSCENTVTSLEFLNFFIRPKFEL